MSEARKLLELADRVEKLAGPDREVDGLIYIALYIPAERAGRIDHINGCVGWSPKDAPYVSAIDVPRYTASLDAAMTLVPEGYRVWLELNVTFPYAKPHGAWVGGNSSYRENYTRAATPALALTAASLRARAQGEG